MTEPVLSALGLALRGGGLAVGDAPSAEACRRKKARLVLLASDAAGNTADKARRLAEAHGVPVETLPYDKSQVGAALGRSVCALAAVTDAGMAALILSKLAKADPVRYGEQAARLEADARRLRKRAAPPGERNLKETKRGTVK